MGLRRTGGLAAAVAALAVAAPAAHAAVFTVTSTADSGAGTFRQAILDANAAGGADTITFDIPGDGVHTIAPLTPLPTITGPVAIAGYTQPGASANTKAVGDDAVLEIELSAALCNCPFNPALLVTAGGSLIQGLVIDGSWNAGIWLDGSSGSVIAGNVVGLTPAGAAAGMAGNGIVVNNSPQSVVGGPHAADRNIVDENGTGFSGTAGIAVGGAQASGNTVENDYVGVDASGTAAQGNPGTGVSVTGPGVVLENDVVSGNGGDGVTITGYSNDAVRGSMIGADVTGHAALGNGGVGVDVHGSANAKIGGPDTGDGNVIVANGSDGVQLASGNAVAQSALVQGNDIGTDGTKDLGNAGQGIDVNGGQQLGDAFLDNVISGNGYTYENGNGCVCSAGILLFAHPSGITIQGNLIGVAADGTTALPNAGRGVDLADGSGVEVGGTGAGDGNVIAHNGEEPGEQGVDVRGTQDSILGNSIYANSGLGIDLNDNGVVDPNDDGDGDAGANGTQNFPVLTLVSSTSTATSVGGTLNSLPGTYRAEFFANASCDASGNGEGQTFLGSTSVDVDKSGNGSFAVTLPVAAAPGDVVTATATDANGDTSEFSACSQVPPSSGSADLVLTDTAVPDAADTGDTVTFVLSVVNAGPDDAPDVVVTDPLPAGLSLRAAKSSTGSCTSGATIVCGLGTIASGGSAVVKISAVPFGDGGTITNTGSVSSAADDPRPASNSASASVDVTAADDVGLSLFATPASSVQQGDDLTYAVGVTNEGFSTPSQVGVEIDLSADVTFVSGSGCSYTDFPLPQLSCTLAGPAPGGLSQATVVVRPKTTGGLVASGRISDTGLPDTNFANNQATVTRTVIAPGPPSITSFSTSDTVSVTAGAAGAHVHLTGTNLGTAFEVDFGGVPAARTTVLSPTEVEAVVPDAAKTGTLTVKTVGGTATSKASFTVVRITGMSPTVGKVGTSVTITGGPFYGTNYNVHDVFFGGGVRADGSLPSSSKLVVTVPAGAVNGQIEVEETNGAGIVVSPQQFAFRPSIADVYDDADHSIRGGAAGSKVDIVGTHLEGGQVFFNGKQATQVAGSGSLLVATIPAGATTGAVTVKTAGGTATSSQTIAVERIGSISATSGYVGSTLTISGDAFSGTGSGGVTGARIGSSGVPFTVVSAHEVQLTVEPGVGRGPVTLSTAFGPVASSQTFTRDPLQITGVSPAAAAPGETITITGHGFWPGIPVEVDIGAFPASDVQATVVSPTKITAVVPAAAESNVLQAKDQFDPPAFHVFYVIPDVLSVSSHLFPGVAAGIAGAQIDIGGAGFLSAGFKLNGLSLTTDPLSTSATHVLATLPVGATSGHLAATTGGPTDTSVDTLTIERITGFSPSHGAANTPVTIGGVAFGTSGWNQVESVAFGGVATRAFMVPSSGQVKLLVPAGAKTGKITIQTPLGTIASSGTFSVP